MDGDMTEQKAGEAAGLRGPGKSGSLGGASWSGYLAACVAGLVLVLTWLGPAPSAGLGTVQRLFFWAAHVLPAAILLQGAQIVLARNHRLSRLPPLVQVGLAGLAGAMLFTPVALVLDIALDPPNAADDPAEPLPLRLAMEFLFLSGPLVLSWALINAPALFGPASVRRPVIARPQARDASDLAAMTPPPDATGAAAPAEKVPDATGADSGRAELFNRLPRQLGHDILALSAELHYLRVYTPLGNTLILFAFGRAVEAMGSSGLQIHRSHWVSFAHVADVVTKGGRSLCKLDTGLELPVSRANRRALRAALTRQPDVR